MKKFITLMILSALCLGAKAQYQVDNSDFEEGWDDVTYNKITGMEPKHWNSFLTGTGTYKYTACKVSQVASSSDIRPGSKGSCSVKISDYKVFLSNYAQGNLTTGCINMGSMTASNAGSSASSPGNCNFTDTSNDEFNQQFTGLPDAMHVWVKFISTNSSYRAKATTILHTAGYYQDPAPDNNDCEGKVVANATKTDISSSSDWQELEIPFEYLITDGTKPAYALVSFSTNSTPGRGTGKDYMIIDDLEYIYYHSLSSCTYDGQQVTFDGNDSASVSALYDESKLAYVKKGVGAIVEKAYDNATGVLTITVKGNDYAADNNSVTRYTIQFKKPSDVVSEKSYTETLYVTINGETTEPQDANVLVQTRYDGNFNFVLKNFVLDGSIPVGNINVPSLTKNPDGSFSFQEKTIIQAGDLEGVDENEWLGPLLGEVPLDLKGQFVGEDHLRVSIDIDMTTSDLGQFISVHLGYDAASLAVKSAAKYGTFCAPFDVTIPAGVTAYIISGIAENGKLSLVEQKNTILAHTPVIVYSESTSDINAVQFGVATSGTATSDYLKGVYTDTTAPVGSYVLQNQGGRVGFYHVEGTQPWVRANRAYLTVPASANVKAFYMDDATAIQTVEELLSGKAEIYDLAGRRQQKLQKGINIVGGKKVLVK